MTSTDPAGEHTAEPTGLELTGASIAIDGQRVELSWQLEAPPAAGGSDDEFSWMMFLTDGERSRAVVVHQKGNRWDAVADLLGPKDRARVALPIPTLEGSTVRLVTDLETLRWNGGDVDWLVRTTRKPPSGDPTTVDEIAERRFTADGGERHDAVRRTSDVKPPEVDWNVLEKWRHSALVVPSDLPKGWTFLSATVLKKGDHDFQPLAECDRIVLTYGIPRRQPTVELFQAHPSCLPHATPFENVVRELPRREFTVGDLSGWALTGFTEPTGALFAARLQSDTSGVIAFATYATPEELAVVLNSLAPFRR